VAYTLYFRGLRSAAADTAALLTLLEPLTGTVLAALILGDRLAATGIARAVILAVAVILTALTQARPVPAAGREPALAAAASGRRAGGTGR
jgi:DME family drug/metabolite transporter